MGMHASVDLIQGTSPGVKGKPLYVVLKDDNFGLLWEPIIMQLSVWSKGDNSVCVCVNTHTHTVKNEILDLFNVISLINDHIIN